jgi:subtilisin family serine protease
MKKYLLGLIFGLVLLPVFGYGQIGRYIVVLKTDAPRAGLVKREFNSFNGYVSDLTIEQLRRLEKDSRVRFVEPDRKVSVECGVRNAECSECGVRSAECGFGIFSSLIPHPSSLIPQTPVASWGLDRVDQRDLPIDNIYDYTATGAGVRVYIVDSGIRFTHSEFGGRAVPGFDAIGDGQNGNDCFGHGSHVAGTVGGLTSGVAKDVQLVSVRVFDCTGSGQISNVLAGVDWINSQIPKGKGKRFPMVVNMSLSFGGSSPALAQAIEASIALGAVYTVAAGNQGLDACSFSPSQMLNVITVAATDETDAKPLFSNNGVCVDLYAPGVNITSANFLDDTSFAVKTGTSMSSPHAAGVAALYLELHPKATPAAVATAIVLNATPVTAGPLVFSLF